MKPGLLVAIITCAVAAAGVLLGGTHAVAMLAVYPALGVLPGMAFAGLLFPTASPRLRAVVGLAIAPLVASTLGWALVVVGMTPVAAARAIALGAGLVWIATETRTARAPMPAPADDESRWVCRTNLLAVGTALLVAIPPLVNVLARVRSDSWVHAGIVWDVLDLGFPPQDPRFAGLTLNYVWFYNWFIGLLCSFHRQDPFAFMAMLNVADTAVLVGLVFALGHALWGRAGDAFGAALVALGGLAAGAWILAPLVGLKGLTGQVRGLDAVLVEYHLPGFGSWRILYDLTAPFAHMVNVLEKFTIGTAINYAWIMMLLMLLAVVRWLAGGTRAWLLVAALAALGQLLFHGVVGLSAIPVTMGALAVTLMLPWIGLPAPERGRVLAALVAVAGGVLAGLPYTRAISAGWSAGKTGLQHSFLAPQPQMLWTLLTACFVVGALAFAPARRLARAHATGSFLVAWTLGMLVFGAIVNLPVDNESKFAFQVHFGLALFAGGALGPWLAGIARRRGRGVAAIVFVALFAAAPLLTLQAMALAPTVGYPSEIEAGEAERAAYAWLAQETPRESIVVDSDFRDAVMVMAPRRLYCGSPEGPTKAAFPADQVAERHAVMKDLYAPTADLSRARASLARLPAPVYVVYRANRARPNLPPELHPLPVSLGEGFDVVYDHAGVRIFGLRPETPSPTPAGGSRP